MFGKKNVPERNGLAPVLSVALLTLGVIIAVSLLWIFLSKLIKTDREMIGPDCLTTNLEIVSCQTMGICNYYDGSQGYNSDVLIKRGVGEGNLTGIRFSFEDILSRKSVYDANLTSLMPGYTLEELQSLRFNQYPSKVPTQGPENILKVFPLLGKNYEVCPIASNPFTCLKAQNVPSIGSLPGSSDSEGMCCQCPRNESECYNGQDVNYPILNGIVHYYEGGVLTPYNYKVPPGNISVCCENVPVAYSGKTILGFTYPTCTATGSIASCPICPLV